MIDRPGLPAVKIRRARQAMVRLAEKYRREASLAAGAALIFSWIAMAAVATLIMRWGSH